MIGFRLIEDYVNLNKFSVVEELAFAPNQDTKIYFQLGDHTGLRYLPIIGGVVEVTFENIDSAHVITRLAVQVIPTDDRSIWSVEILPNEVIAAGSMTIKLTEGSVIRNLSTFSELVVTPTATSRFFI